LENEDVMNLNQTMMAPLTYAERVGVAAAAGLTRQADTTTQIGSRIFMDPTSHVDRVAAAAVDEGVEDIIPGGIDYPYSAPSFYEQHKTKILIVGGVAVVLAIGGGTLLVRRSRSRA
jgi:hypothetical protein